jgi:hypothetical protein
MMNEVLSSLFGAPVPPIPGNREDNELLIFGPIFLFAGFMAAATMMAIRQLSEKNSGKAE